MTLLKLYWIFAKIGIFTYGGGYAMIPLFYDELVRRYQVISAADFGNIVAIAQMTPGPIGINAATYIGYMHGGLAGAAVGTLGLLTPSLVIILIVVHFFDRFQHSVIVQGMLAGIRPATLGLIAAAVLFFAEMSIFTAGIPFDWLFGLLRGTSGPAPSFGISWPAVLIFAAAWVAADKFKVNIFWIILGAAVAGAII